MMIVKTIGVGLLAAVAIATAGAAHANPDPSQLDGNGSPYHMGVMPSTDRQLVNGTCRYLAGNGGRFSVSYLLSDSYADMTAGGINPGYLLEVYEAASKTPACADYKSDMSKWLDS